MEVEDILKSINNEGDLENSLENWQSISSSSVYGWGKFTPKYLQFMNNPKWFLVISMIYCLIAGITFFGLSILVLPMIEKRFSFTSTELGVIASAIDITALAIGVFISYYGDYVNKIRWIGGGAALGGLGAFLFAVPHFLVGPYTPTIFETAAHPTCSLSNNTDHLSTPGCSEAENQGWHYFAIFIISQLISGVSVTTFNALVPPYLDENVEPKKMPLYLGFWYGTTFFGPSVGLFIAGALLNVYVDIKQPVGITLSPDDLEWIGAWWLGYVCFGMVFSFCSIFILGYPRYMPGAVENREKHIKSGHLKSSNECKEAKLAEIVPQLKCLLMNWTFLFNSLGIAALSFFASGLATFYAKFVEVKFGIDPITIGYILSAVLVPVTLGGVFLGSFIVKQFSLSTTCKKSALVLLISILVIAACPLSLLLPGCQNANIAVVSSHHSRERNNASKLSSSVTNVTFADNCNNNCGCSLDDFLPVCGRDNITYFSGCYAGCAVQNTNKTFTNCSCIPTDESDNHFGGMAQVGFCDRGCKNFALIQGILAIEFFFEFLSVVPSQTVVLRCVPDNKRSFAVGMQYIMMKVLALIPGPIIFGHIFDTSCRLWEDICGEQGRCLDYDVDALSFTIAILGCLCLVASTFLLFVSWYTIKIEPENIPQSDGIEEEATLPHEDTEL